MIYADLNGTAPLLKEVKDYIQNRLNGPFANPNSIHSLGNKVRVGMEKARRVCADTLGASPSQIIFNSGSSEGISHVLYHFLQTSSKDEALICSKIEHSAVLKACEYAQTMGRDVHWLNVDAEGVILLDELEKTLQEKKIGLVSIMASNNETGVIQPIEQIAKLCKQYQALFFSDTTQFIGKCSFDFEKSGMDFAVCSGHKIGALTGVGILICKNPEKLTPLIFGGGQEKGLRGGTQNYLAIETMAVALNFFHQHYADFATLNQYRDEFENALQGLFPSIKIIGKNADRLPGTSLISYPGLHGQAIQIELESKNIFVTTSSACSDNEPNTSKVLKAMGVDDKVGRGVVRISVCFDDAQNKYQSILKALKDIYPKLSRVSSF